MALQAFKTLHTGAKMPVLGFGTWQAKPGEVAQAVRHALDAGYRHFDCARIYMNEDEIGAVFKDVLGKGKIKREDLFIVTKLWNTDHNPVRVEAACKESLARLQLDYVDLYLIHWPVQHQPPKDWKYDNLPGDCFPRNAEGGCTFETGYTMADTWAAMEALVDKGLTRHIGVSNFTLEEIVKLNETARIKPATNQVECQPALPQNELRAELAKLGMPITSYCPLGLGMEGVINDGGVMAHPVLAEIAKMAGDISVPELMLRWNVQKGNIVLTKSVTPARIQSNAAIADGGLSEEVMAAMEEFGVKHPRRVGNPNFFREKKGDFFPQ